MLSFHLENVWKQGLDCDQTFYKEIVISTLCIMTLKRYEMVIGRADDLVIWKLYWQGTLSTLL